MRILLVGWDLNNFSVFFVLDAENFLHHPKCAASVTMAQLKAIPMEAIQINSKLDCSMHLVLIQDVV